MVFSGFSASYVALDPFDDEDEEMSSDSSEMVTPFPGYLKNIYITGGEDEDGYIDYDDYTNKVKHTKINSDNTLSEDLY